MLSIACNVIVVFLGICIIQNAGLECKPDISEGRNNFLEISGHVYIQCDVQTCGNVNKITYEKNISQTWVPLFEGVNTTYHHAFDTHQAYSLKGRTFYVAFTSLHTLSINPLILEDQGEWRCVAHDEYGNKIASQPVIINYGSTCTPEISEGRAGILEINGHTTLVCDMCGTFNKLIFDKKINDDKWTNLYIANKTYNHAINASNDDYSLENRTHYVVFPERHILNIQPLQLNDGGKWRCVTVHQNDIRKESNTIEVFIANPVEDTSSIIPKIYVVLKDNAIKYFCKFDKKYFEPPLAWTLNGTDINPRNYEVNPHNNPLQENVLELPIDIARNSSIGCKVQSKTKPGIWTSNSIVVDIEAIFRYSHSTQTSSYSYNCQGMIILTIVLVLLAVVPVLWRLTQFLKQLQAERGTQPNSEEPHLLNNTEDSTGAAT